MTGRAETVYHPFGVSMNPITLTIDWLVDPFDAAGWPDLSDSVVTLSEFELSTPTF